MRLPLLKSELLEEAHLEMGVISVSMCVCHNAWLTGGLRGSLLLNEQMKKWVNIHSDNWWDWQGNWGWVVRAWDAMNIELKIGLQGCFPSHVEAVWPTVSGTKERWKLGAASMCSYEPRHHPRSVPKGAQAVCQQWKWKWSRSVVSDSLRARGL